ncbi:beta-N-acetylhexosaminidase [Herbidospora yilanensis]|uniref:beta-N-acetylhexosaminidase n=1 Tax=Herbidospora yilanensis TaxID=354426 RepID=UPI000781A11F|nr:beta-N-acetylhexosaminidase [Herbidospora yilanensis]
MRHFLPAPRSVEALPGVFPLTPGFGVAGDLAEPVRRALAALGPVIGDGPVSVRRHGAPESSTLTVRADDIEILAGDAAGAFYAAQTLRQLLPHDAFRAVSPLSAYDVPCVRVADAPALSWRGAHLDVSRHFLPKHDVLRMIDLLAMHKLNRLHLHLADDQGWRVESRAYPRLHEIGSHRAQTITSRKGEPESYDATPHGGFYTLDDLREIAAYARQRAVTVVPEIDVPGHASAILAAYPEFGADPSRRHRVLERWGISPAILAPLPKTIDFLATVFDEVLGALGETPFFHIGGDECVLDAWAASTEITAFQRAQHLATPGDLHAWFLRRLADLLAERGSRAVVWDEAFVSGMLRDDTVVMPWRGTNVARRAIAAGHDVVLTPVFPLYFDYAEAASADEPAALGESITVGDVAAFDVAAERVLGAQFQLWSEYIPDARTLDYKAWPRGCAMAEIAWTGRPAAPDFLGRLEHHLGRLDAAGVNYRPLDGPRPWQRSRPHTPGGLDVAAAMRHLDELTLSADSTRPSM